jgi:hypothetical protein
MAPQDSQRRQQQQADADRAVSSVRRRKESCWIQSFPSITSMMALTESFGNRGRLPWRSRYLFGDCLWHAVGSTPPVRVLCGFGLTLLPVVIPVDCQIGLYLFQVDHERFVFFFFLELPLEFRVFPCLLCLSFSLLLKILGRRSRRNT